MPRINMSVYAAISALTVLFAASGTAIAQNNQTGVLALYSAGNPQTDEANETKVRELGCNLHRDGIIGGEQGSIGLAKPNRFLLLVCEGTVLGDTAKRTILDNVFPSAKILATFEGDFAEMPDAQRPSAVAGRQYILKISNYNNKDVDKRDRELAELTQQAGLLPDTYVTESFIGVNLAEGLPTPDEVVVLFYDDPQTGDRFRKNNPEMLKKIGKFNETHLVNAVYYVGKVAM